MKEIKVAFAVKLAINGKMYPDRLVYSLEEIKAEWEEQAAKANRDGDMEVYYASGSQVVWRDRKHGMVMTAWTENPQNAVSFQVLEMG